MKLNLTRALIFSILWWIIAFVSISILMFLPWVRENDLKIQIIWWIVEIPLVLLLAKWYFKRDPPTWKKGIVLALFALIIGSILDAVVTVPMIGITHVEFFGNPLMYVGYMIFFLVVVYAGWEYDKTYTTRLGSDKK